MLTWTDLCQIRGSSGSMDGVMARRACHLRQQMAHLVANLQYYIQARVPFAVQCLLTIVHLIFMIKFYMYIYERDDIIHECDSTCLYIFDRSNTLFDFKKSWKSNIFYCASSSAFNRYFSSMDKNPFEMSPLSHKNKSYETC